MDLGNPLKVRRPRVDFRPERSAVERSAVALPLTSAPGLFRLYPHYKSTGAPSFAFFAKGGITGANALTLIQ